MQAGEAIQVPPNCLSVYSVTFRSMKSKIMQLNKASHLGSMEKTLDEMRDFLLVEHFKEQSMTFGKEPTTTL
jgi:hypothetical protein